MARGRRRQHSPNSARSSATTSGLRVGRSWPAARALAPRGRPRRLRRLRRARRAGRRRHRAHPRRLPRGRRHRRHRAVARPRRAALPALRRVRRLPAPAPLLRGPARRQGGGRPRAAPPHRPPRRRGRPPDRRRRRPLGLPQPRPLLDRPQVRRRRLHPPPRRRPAEGRALSHRRPVGERPPAEAAGQGRRPPPGPGAPLRRDRAPRSSTRRSPASRTKATRASTPRSSPATASRVSASSFFQVNSAQAEVDGARSSARPSPTSGDLLVDAFAGVGTFAVLFAPPLRAASSPSRSPAAPPATWRRTSRTRRTSSSGSARSSTSSPLLDAAPDAVLLDPPRPGCAPPVLDAIVEFRPTVVVYVSCNPATLARDLRRLVDGGYALDHVTPLDMFPQTGPHRSRRRASACRRDGA